MNVWTLPRFIRYLYCRKLFLFIVISKAWNFKTYMYVYDQTFTYKFQKAKLTSICLLSECKSSLMLPEDQLGLPVLLYLLTARVIIKMSQLS